MPFSGTCLISVLFILHRRLARHLFIHLLQEMLYLMESCHSPFIKGVKEPVCQLHTHICTYICTHMFPLLTTGLPNHGSFSASVSGKICVLTLPILKLALILSLVTQTRTDSSVSSWFFFPVSPSQGKKEYMGNKIHSGKRKFSLKRQARSNVVLKTTRNYKEQMNTKGKTQACFTEHSSTSIFLLLLLLLALSSFCTLHMLDVHRIHLQRGSFLAPEKHFAL